MELRRSVSTDMPLYPSEEQIARAVLSPAKLKDWLAIAAVDERKGLPRIDNRAKTDLPSPGLRDRRLRKVGSMWPLSSICSPGAWSAGR
jgi:hypothetical protein